MIDDEDDRFTESVKSSEDYDDYIIGIKSKNQRLRLNGKNNSVVSRKEGSVRTSNVGDDSLFTCFGDTSP